MDFGELAYDRRSIRGFSARQVSCDVVEKLLEAAVQAPSAGNCQPWHFYAVTNTNVISEIHEKAYRAEWFLSAPLCFVVCTDAQRCAARYEERGKSLYCIQDTAAAIENILLCARDLELDTCWCGAFDEDAVSGILNIPRELRPVALIPTGYAKERGEKRNRRPISEVVTYVK